MIAEESEVTKMDPKTEISKNGPVQEVTDAYISQPAGLSGDHVQFSRDQAQFSGDQAQFSRDHAQFSSDRAQFSGDHVQFAPLPSYSDVVETMNHPTSDTKVSVCGRHIKWVAIAIIVVSLCLLCAVLGSVYMVHIHSTSTGPTQEYQTHAICSPSPCYNGNCFIAEDNFICKCHPGFSGILCETNKNECAGNPCGRLSTCEDGINHFTCHCRAGFTGTLCDQEIDECLSSPCVNGATCTEDTNSYQCECAPGYTGRHCETNLDECLSGPCDNGGTCEDLENGYRCHCPRDFIGATCRTGVQDRCPSGFTLYPDLGHCYYIHETSNVTWAEAEADCVLRDAALASLQTQDELDYLGRQVQRLDMLYSVGGRRVEDEICVGCNNQFYWKTGEDIASTDVHWWYSESSYYHRGCTAFWKPSPRRNPPDVNASYLVSRLCRDSARYVCERDVLNVCLSDPCMHGATCQDGVGHRCLCVPGFTGSRCETEINECSSDPCRNGGLCLDHINGYTCQCVGNFTGDNCQIDPTVQCPEGFLLYREQSRCYLIVEDPQLAWGDAHEMCEHRGASLASLETVSELQYVGAQLQMEGRYHLVSGCRERDGEFYWSTQSVLHVAHSAWAANEPRARKDCTAVIARDGLARLYSVRCDDARPYVCERGTL